ncbi:MAG TPA: hypothetical protein DCL15_18595 [Chloroflexi bacterium]|nr:hypothetical protein [Chloroflexota bacterium]HHW88590.1 YIP1 family protein [Chloroflexota bacterium]
MNFAEMWQTWLKATTSPNEATFADLRQKPEANVTTAIIWMAIYGAVSAVVGIIGGLMFASTMRSVLPGVLEQLELPPAEAAQVEQALRAVTGGGFGMAGFASLANIVMAPLFFLIGVGIYFLLARLLGGNGDFGRYAYLNAAFAAPLGILTTLLSLVPFAGCISPLITIYSLVLVYFATKAEHQLSSGRAIWVVLIPVLVVFALLGCFLFSIIGFVASLQNR